MKKIRENRYIAFGFGCLECDVNADEEAGVIDADNDLDALKARLFDKTYPEASIASARDGYGIIAHVRLTFELVGKPVSNNRVTRRFGNRSVKSTEARSYQQRVFQHAFVAVQQQGWTMPEACAVTIDAYNVRQDVGNLEKCVNDGMEGSVFENDRCVIELTVRKHKDAGEERLIVTVEHREPLTKPKRKRAA